MTIKWVLLGGGGHGRVLLATLRALGWENRLIGIVDPEPVCPALQTWNVPLLGNDECLWTMSPQEIQLLNGLGSAANTTRRKEVYQRFQSRGYGFQTLCHPTAWVADSADLAEGVQVMAGAIVQTGCRLGNNVLINTRAIVDHDCLISEHVHVASGAVLCGDVWIGAGTHIGAGSTVIQGVHIGVNACIGAGSVVVRDIPDETKVVGVPAKELCK